MNSGFSIRCFRAEDLDRVMAINMECLPENYSSYFYIDLHRRFPETFLVAEVDGQIQGYIMCRIERGFSKLHTLRPMKLCHVVSIAVRGSYRRRGIGTALMLAAMKNSKEEYGAGECYLEVRVSNEPAIKFYEKLGFMRVGKRRGYYMDGEDALIMALSLTRDPMTKVF